MKDFEKQSAINRFLRDLSEQSYNDDAVLEKSRILLSIYKDGFRHSYSQISGTIYSIKDDHKKYDTEYLSNHMGVLYKRVNAMTRGDDLYEINKEIVKLYDHVSLEIARLAQWEKIQGEQREIERKMEEAIEELSEAKGKIEVANKELLETKRETRNLKTEIVAILSIFAAIILTFSGGISFTNATLSSMHESSIYKVAFVSIICGFTLFNMIFCLMLFISRLTGTNIFFKCTKGECILDKCSEQQKCSVFYIIMTRMPYVFIINSIFLALLIIVVVSWFLEIKIFAEALRSYIWCRLNY